MRVMRPLRPPTQRRTLSLSRQRRILRDDLRRDDAKIAERVRNPLLLGKHFPVDGLIDMRVMPQARFDHASVESLNGCELCCCFAVVRPHPRSLLADFIHRDCEHVAVLLRKRSRAQEELVMAHNPFRVGE